MTEFLSQDEIDALLHGADDVEEIESGHEHHFDWAKIGVFNI